MLQFSLFGIKLKVDYLLISLIALFSFFDNGKIMLLALLTAFMHELGHIISAELIGGGVRELYFTAIGIRMKTTIPLQLLNFWRKLIVLSSGCALNLIMAGLFYLAEQKKAMLFHLVTACFNILPVGTLDGGRILTEILTTRFPVVYAEKVCDVISIILSVMLFVLGVYVFLFSGYNFSLLITSFYLALMVLLRQKRLN